MPEKLQEIRMAVTEARLDGHEKFIEAQQATTNRLIDKLDKHIVASQDRDDRIQNNLSEVTIAVTKLSGAVTDATEAIRVITPAVNEGKQALTEWHAIRKTIVVIATVLVTLGSGSWAVFTYVNHNSSAEQTTGQK